MHLTFVLIVGVISAVAVAAFSRRLGLAAPLGLVIVGTGLSFVPGVPHPDIPPQWFLAGVLPPLLYSAAVNMPFVDFRRNLRPITGLAVLLVVVTTLATGWFFHWMLPGIGWPAAFALGAVVSPTDAVAATSVGRRLGLPRRLLTLLEGEGLVNDATALVLLRSATAAVAATVSLWSIAGQFLYAVTVAVVTGLVVGVVNVRARAWLKDAVLNTAVSFVVPFAAYLPAEELDGSGVLAVVVAGLVAGNLSPRHLRAQDRIAELTNWRTLAFLLECATFVFMGLSLNNLLAQTDGDLSAGRVVVIGLAATALVIALRVVFTPPLVVLMRGEHRRATRVQPKLDRLRSRLDDLDPNDARYGTRRMAHIRHRVFRAAADVEFHLTETLGWRGGVVLAWSGMRGAITVAAAQTLPETTPLRPQLILIAFIVATVTLLAQGLTLPAVIGLVKVPGDDPAQLRADHLRLAAELSAVDAEVLDDPRLTMDDGRRFDPTALRRARADSQRLVVDDDTAETDTEAELELRRQYLQLRLRVLAAENARLVRIRAVGSYSSESLSHVQYLIDVDTARLQQLAEKI